MNYCYLIETQRYEETHIHAAFTNYEEACAYADQRNAGKGTRYMVRPYSLNPNLYQEVMECPSYPGKHLPIFWHKNGPEGDSYEGWLATDPEICYSFWELRLVVFSIFNQVFKQNGFVPDKERA